jgi:sigma-E factor negative regulatory protein RseA
MKSQLSEVSALLDGELEPHEQRPVLKAVVRDQELREAWQAYALIGDQLRQECPYAADLTARVMARIGEEPVVLAPRSLPLASRQRPLLALAASVAGVTMVGWLALAGNPGAPQAENRFAAVSPAPTFARASNTGSASVLIAPVGRTAPVAAPARGDMSEYLLAHHTQASTFRLGDNTEHVRTVSMTGRSVHP